jgi:soluble lytic murein transglycosylase-like protein
MAVHDVRSHRRSTFGALALAGALLAPAGASAELYQWTDARGVVHLTDVQKTARYQKVAYVPPSDMGLRVFAPSTGRSRFVLKRTGRGRAVAPQNHRSYDPVIRSASLDHGVPAALVKAVIAAESSFDAAAVSPKGAMGLMQLMPGTAQELGVDDAFHSEQNVQGGTRYLRELYDRYGDWLRTLAAYNAGPEAVDRYDGVPPYDETREYVKRVLSYYRRFHDDFAR